MFHITHLNMIFPLCFFLFVFFYIFFSFNLLFWCLLTKSLFYYKIILRKLTINLFHSKLDFIYILFDIAVFIYAFVYVLCFSRQHQREKNSLPNLHLPKIWGLWFAASMIFLWKYWKKFQKRYLRIYFFVSWFTMLSNNST